MTFKGRQPVANGANYVLSSSMEEKQAGEVEIAEKAHEARGIQVRLRRFLGLELCVPSIFPAAFADNINKSRDTLNLVATLNIELANTGSAAGRCNSLS